MLLANRVGGHLGYSRTSVGRTQKTGKFEEDISG